MSGRDDLPNWARERMAELERTGEVPAVTRFLKKAGRKGAGIAIIVGLVAAGLVPAMAVPDALLGGGPMDGLTFQAIAAAAIPILLMVLRQVAKVIDDGPAVLWINAAIQVLVALGVTLGLDVDPGTAAMVAGGGMLGGAGLREHLKAADRAVRG